MELRTSGAMALRPSINEQGEIPEPTHRKKNIRKKLDRTAYAK